MGTLASELAPIVADLSPVPHVYVDANLPASAVDFMRHALRWDVLFVLEEPDLRRAPDARHFARARELRRVLVTMDCDFLDSRRYPPEAGPGVLVCRAPDEPRLLGLLREADRTIFTASDRVGGGLGGRTVELTPTLHDANPAHRRRRRPARSGRRRPDARSRG